MHKLLLGTHTSGSEQNHLMVAEVRLPLEDTEIDARKFDDEAQGPSRGGLLRSPYELASKSC